MWQRMRTGTIKTRPKASTKRRITGESESAITDPMRFRKRRNDEVDVEVGGSKRNRSVEDGEEN